MPYHIFNSPTNPRRERLIEKEFQALQKYLDQLIWKSHTLVSSLKEAQQQKIIEDQLNQLKKRE